MAEPSPSGTRCPNCGHARDAHVQESRRQCPACGNDYRRWPFGQRRCWIFDLDGTLTVAQHDFTAIRTALGIPPGRLILEYLDSLPHALARPLHARLQDIEAELCSTAQPATGAMQLLTTLRARGIELGLLTRKTRENALATLRAAGLAAFFAPPTVLGRDEAPPKPAPDGIQQLLERWGATAADGLMIGDVHLDLAAGRAAGVITVHVSAGTDTRWPDLTDHHFDTLADLDAALR
jgi:HAD superfamily hydrolase (TIGR01509 family)